MATATKPSNNGTTRRTLASQIDRLDDILDGLGDALNESIATAMEKAVGVAVEKAIENVMTALLSKPELLANLQDKVAEQQPAAVKPNTQNRFVRFGRKIAASWNRTCQMVRRGTACIRRTATSICYKVRRFASRCWMKFREFAPPKGELILALGVGAAIAIGAFFSGPWLASVAGGIGGAATTLATNAFVRLRRMIEYVKPSSAAKLQLNTE